MGGRLGFSKGKNLNLEPYLPQKTPITAHQHFEGGQRDLGRDRVAAVGAAVLPRLDAQHDLRAPRTQA